MNQLNLRPRGDLTPPLAGHESVEMIGLTRVSNLSAPLGHTGRKRVVLGYTLNRKHKTDEQKNGFK